ncbi:hypothetical protein [Cellulomonas fimi]|uniref:DUF559 domain-containing protein n=1 Tax=Cellulomonas fimi TaxID=1708 RepID=A0A7Y0M0U0_CELFI|nr:hypothetical protein [Cellulomonas fimi]NMR20362.1 hypothetical protein [Cellulomonas fimi]
MSRDPRFRAARRLRVVHAARFQAGILSRSQVRSLGLTADEVQAEVEAGRWQPRGASCLLVSPDDGVGRSDWWLAVLEAAPRSAVEGAPRAALGGVTALVAAGLEGVHGDRLIHVVAPKSSHPVPAAPGVRIHETRRWTDDDVIRVGGIPCVRPAVACVQAAIWARTDREAALMLCSPIQQRVTAAHEVAEVLRRIRRDRRRTFMVSVVAEIGGGAQSLNELDFAVLCRRRGLPEPDRQVLVTGPNGRAYLDVRWARWKVVVEVDGVGHLRVDRWIDDSLRHNEIALRGGTVLRVPSLGLRLDEDVHMAVVERALVAAGWRRGT